MWQDRLHPWAVFTETSRGFVPYYLAGIRHDLRQTTDTLTVWRLDRLGRSLKHLIETITKLNNRKIGFKSITENIDTTTSGGKLVFYIFGALAEFERDIISERTNAGLSAARARGRLGGRPKAKTLDTPKKITLAQSLYENRNNTIDEICKTLNVSRATLYRYIKTKNTEK